jgi:hypothetical protein
MRYDIGSVRITIPLEIGSMETMGKDPNSADQMNAFGGG